MVVGQSNRHNALDDGLHSRQAEPLTKTGEYRSNFPKKKKKSKDTLPLFPHNETTRYVPREKRSGKQGDTFRDPFVLPHDSDDRQNFSCFPFDPIFLDYQQKQVADRACDVASNDSFDKFHHDTKQICSGNIVGEEPPPALLVYCSCRLLNVEALFHIHRTFHSIHPNVVLCSEHLPRGFYSPSWSPTCGDVG